MEFFTVAVLIILLLVYLYYKRSFQYWENKGVMTIKPKIPFGNFGLSSKEKSAFVLKVVNFYKEFKSKGVKYGGLYVGPTPILFVIHPETIKTILTKDFQYFSSHGTPFNEEVDPLGAHLFNMDGRKWKDMRVKLTPTFTSGKMKMMFQTLLDCGEQFKEFVDNCHHQEKALDIKEILSCFTTDVIGSCAFGLECNSFKNPDAEFRSYGRKLFAPNFKFQLKRFVNVISPSLVKLMRLRFIPEEISAFFTGVVKDTVEYRQSTKTTRNDFLQLLIDMQEQAKLEGKEVFTLKQMSAQAFVFFIAGFETSSTTMTFCSYELAHHQDIQQKLRDEINRTIEKHNGKLTYDGIMEMNYLDQVINETLRKYPPVHLLPRLCTQNYKFPNGAEVEKGTTVMVPILGLQSDEEYYPNPEKFDPDRFSQENKDKLHPFTFIPFGEGPRMCIGLRFGVMQAKVGMCLLLKNYRISPHKSLRYPMEFDSKALILIGKETILLTTEKV